jgi:exonuclease III
MIRSEKALELIEERSLIDPYRQLYPDSYRYTWRKKNPFRQARLDFFLFTESMLTNLKNCTMFIIINFLNFIPIID